MSFDYDTSAPADNGVVAQFPANERTFRATMQAVMAVEHAPGTGHHKIPYGDDTARDAISDWPSGAIFYNTAAKCWQLTDSPSPSPNWIDISNPYAVIPQGTAMVFAQAAAPTGWTKVTSQNDRMLRVVSGTGGGTGGSWTISGVTVDGHALTIQEMPVHHHGGAPGQAAGQGGGSAYYNRNGQTEDTGGGQAHTHGLTADGSWRPAYQNVIVCTRN